MTPPHWGHHRILPVIRQVYYCPSKYFIAFGLRRYPQNSLLIPCFKTRFSDFGQNLMIPEVVAKNSLFISLLLRENLLQHPKKP
jgi:hypothetical protein